MDDNSDNAVVYELEAKAPDDPKPIQKGWRPVGPEVLPPGVHVRLDMNTGQAEVEVTAPEAVEGPIIRKIPKAKIVPDAVEGWVPPPPPTTPDTAPVALKPERAVQAVRHAQISVELRELHSRYKKEATQTFETLYQIGIRLIEMKKDLGRGFKAWIEGKDENEEHHCPFSYSTARNYVHLVEKVDEWGGYARVASFVVPGTVRAIEDHVSRKGFTTSQRLEKKAKYEETLKPATTLKAIYATPPARTTRRKAVLADAKARKAEKREEGREAALADIALKKEMRAAEEAAAGKTDLSKVWKFPHEDCQWMMVELELPEEDRQIAYIWLPEYAHVAAGAAGGKMAKALRYHWIVCREPGAGTKAAVEVDQDERDGESTASIKHRLMFGNVGQKWDAIEAKLSELNMTAKRVIEAMSFDRDPYVVKILDVWRSTRSAR
jgi:hypothetical protein